LQSKIVLHIFLPVLEIEIFAKLHRRVIPATRWEPL